MMTKKKTTAEPRSIAPPKQTGADEDENGEADYTKWHLSTAMLSYLGASPVGFSNGLTYVDGYVDIDRV